MHPLSLPPPRGPLEAWRARKKCFSVLLECYRRFLRVLQQNRAQSGPHLVYLFCGKESVVFPRNSPLFSHPFFISKTK